MFRSLCGLMVCLMVFVGVGQAQNEKPSPLQQRANDVVKSINTPKDFEKTFSSDFLKAVPPAKLGEVFQGLTTQYGQAVRVQTVAPASETAADISVEFSKHVVARMNLHIEARSPFFINGLVITAVDNTAASMEALVDELKALPGLTALSVVQLKGDKLVPKVAYNADASMAVGSSFKLYVLSELVRSIGAGQRHWNDVVELRTASLPSGKLQDWPQGSPLTLHSLACLMISISDNTATDQLIATLGRGPIEKMLATAGNSQPSRSLPFLKTLEMFKIKGETQPNFAANYATSSVAKRRQMLAGPIATFPKEKINLGFLLKPAYINKIEWFASTNDLARVMNWLRLHSTATGDKTRGVLSINKALPATDAAQWAYVGYKGGSETGVMSMTYLLQSKKGDWYVVSGSWNNPAAPLDEAGFASLMTKAVALLHDSAAK